MADLETKVDKLDERVTKIDERVSFLETQFSALVTKVDALSDKIDLIVGEMRDRDNQRAEEIRDIRSSIEGMGKHVRNLVWTGIAAIGGIAITVIYSLLKH